MVKNSNWQEADQLAITFPVLYRFVSQEQGTVTEFTNLI